MQPFKQKRAAVQNNTHPFKEGIQILVMAPGNNRTHRWKQRPQQQRQRSGGQLRGRRTERTARHREAAAAAAEEEEDALLDAF